jgi:hypothetical protein
MFSECSRVRAVHAVLFVLLASGYASAQSPGEGRDLSLGPVDGERLAFFWNFVYEWTGPEGASITWAADQSSNGIELKAVFYPVTETWGIGGEGIVPVNVTTAMPVGSMTGSGSSSIDVGGSYANGLVSLTILETTGGSYTIMVDEYAMSAATPQNINRYEMVFNWNDVIGGLGDLVTIQTGNGFVSGHLELLDAWNPER